MPQGIAVIAAYIVAQSTAVVGSSLLAAQIVYATAYVAVSVGASAALNYALSSLLGGGTPSPSGQTVASTAPVEPNRHLVGRSRTYGVMAQQGSCAAKSGDQKDMNFYQIQTISSTPITEIEKVLISDIELIGVTETLTGSALFLSANMAPYNTGQPAGKSRLFYHYDIGNQHGTRDPLLGWFADQAWQPLVTAPYPDDFSLVPFYSVDARGDGLAKLSSIAYQDVGSFPAGPPRMSIVGKGVACFDPRDPGQDPENYTTWVFTENPALIAAWYITRPFGFNVLYSAIDFDVLTSSANACDELVETFESTLPPIVGAGAFQGFWDAHSNIPAIPPPARANLGWYYEVSTAGFTNINGTSVWNIGDLIISNGSKWTKVPAADVAPSVPMEPRYRCGGEVIESENRDSVLAEICASMAGSWAQSGGRWYIFAGVFIAPTEAIDDTWIMRNVQFVAQNSRLQLYNTVKGAFMSEARRWQTAPYPQVQVAELLASDNGQEIVETIDLAFVPSHTQAQRCMLIELKRSHKPRSFTFETPIGYAMRLVIGTAVSLTQLAAGYLIDDAPFRVANWELAAQDSTGQIWVKISLDEDGADIYASSIMDLHDANALTLSDAPNVPPADSEGGTGGHGTPTGTIAGVFA
jgi:hypothetical protein